MRNRIRKGVVLGLALAAFHAMPEGSVAQTNRWSELFAQIESYGVPNLTTAAYVSVRCRGDIGFPIEDPLPYDWALHGNGWMVSETRDDDGQPVKGVFFVKGGETIETTWDPLGTPFRRLGLDDLLAAPSPELPVLSGTWRKVNPLWDARKSIRFLRSLEGEPVPAYALNPEVRGLLALLAFGLWQQGDATNSSELLSELVARSGPTNDLATDAMNLVANAQYENLYRKFRAEHDWTAYRDGIRNLLAKYPEGWCMAPAMQTLLQRVDERLAQPEPLPAATNGLTEADLKQASGMMRLRAVRKKPGAWADTQVLWLTPSSWRDRAPSPLDVELEIRGRGVEAIPFLLALVKDGALTEVDRETIAEPPAFGWRVEKEKTFETIRRPATRGEVALRWLLDMMPESAINEGGTRIKGEQALAVIQAIHRQYGGTSEEELAIQLLPVDYGRLNESAIRFLLARASQAAIPALEKYLLTEPVTGQDSDYWEGSRYDARLDLAVNYAALRGESARPFVEAFAAELRKEAKEGTVPKDKDANVDAESLEKFLCPLTAEQVLNSLKPGGKPCVGRERAILDAQLNAIPPSEVIRMMLAQAVQTPDAGVRLNLVGKIFSLIGENTIAGLRPTDDAEAWETLISDDREGGCRNKVLVSDEYIKLNERLFAPPVDMRGDWRNEWDCTRHGAGWRAERLIESQGSRGREWLRGRVRQRLAGTSEENLPPYPDATSADKKVLSALREKFTAVADRATAAGATDGLSSPERVALSGLLRQEPELNAKLVGMASRIERVTVHGDVGEWGARFRAWEGQLPTPELLDELRSCCEARSQAESSVTCKLIRKADFGGCELVVEAQKEAPALFSRKPQSSPLIGWVGMVCGPDLYASARWWGGVRTLGKANPPNVRTADPDGLQRFLRMCKEWCGAGMPACDEAFVVFQTQGG